MHSLFDFHIEIIHPLICDFLFLIAACELRFRRRNLNFHFSHSLSFLTAVDEYYQSNSFYSKELLVIMSREGPFKKLMSPLRDSNFTKLCEFLTCLAPCFFSAKVVG